MKSAQLKLGVLTFYIESNKETSRWDEAKD